MGAINGPAVYGMARALQDTESLGREREAFDVDQATRKERLAGEIEARPLRKRVLDMSIADAEHNQQRRPKLEADQDALSALNIDVTKLKKGELESALKEAEKARAVHQKLVTGTRNFQLSTDPSHIAETLKDIDPAFGDVKATRGDDGSITLDGGKGKPITFRGQTKAPDGSVMKPDEELMHFMSNYVDPVKSFQEKYAHAEKKDIENTKTDRAISTAKITAGGRVDAAGVRADAAGMRDANRQSEAWKTKNLGQIKPTLDSMLKTTGVSGSFISGYAHADDAELRGIIEENVEAAVMDGTPVRKASREVIDDVRATYDKASKMAGEKAAALNKAKINPRNQKDVEAAAKAGNEDAKALLQVQAAATQAFGPGVAKYLTTNLPAK